MIEIENFVPINPLGVSRQYDPRRLFPVLLLRASRPSRTRRGGTGVASGGGGLRWRGTRTQKPYLSRLNCDIPVAGRSRLPGLYLTTTREEDPTPDGGRPEDRQSLGLKVLRVLWGSSVVCCVYHPRVHKRIEPDVSGQFSVGTRWPLYLNERSTP